MNGAAENDPVEDGAGVDDEINSWVAGVKSRGERISRGSWRNWADSAVGFHPKPVWTRSGHNFSEMEAPWNSAHLIFS